MKKQFNLGELQADLPWGAHGYSEQHEARTDAGRDFDHSYGHAIKAMGKLFTAATDALAHRGGVDQTEAGEALADVIWNALRMANVMPGGAIDVEQALHRRFSQTMESYRKQHSVDWSGRKVDAKGRYLEVHQGGCHSNNDGDCNWSGCPQLGDAPGPWCPLLKSREGED